MFDCGNRLGFGDACGQLFEFHGERVEFAHRIEPIAAVHRRERCERAQFLADKSSFLNQ